MSTGNRVSLHNARFIAADFIEYIQGVCHVCYEAGSIRRMSNTIGDIEIVVQPHSLAAIWNRIDRMLEAETIKKAIYPDDRKRWGDTMRGLVFSGMRIELHTADENNLGYKYWLQTGPGDKNHYLMGQLIKHQSPIRFDDGYGWHVSYDPTHPSFNRGLGYAKLSKLHIPTEQEFYTLVGMPYIPPTSRNEVRYRQYLARAVNCPPTEAFRIRYVDESTKQRKLF